MRIVCTLLVLATGGLGQCLCAGLCMICLIARLAECCVCLCRAALMLAVRVRSALSPVLNRKACFA